MIENVVDLPFPPSVNRTRRVDWTAHKAVTAWIKAADGLVMLARLKRQKIPGQFEATVTLSEAHGGADLDNGIKAVIDYARRIELVTNDSPKYMRRLVIEWGEAPEGCRLTVRELPS